MSAWISNGQMVILYNRLYVPTSERCAQHIWIETDGHYTSTTDAQVQKRQSQQSNAKQNVLLTILSAIYM